MKAWRSAFLILMSCIVLSGCWDKAELPEFGYVQALAIDQSESGRILLTTLFYRPSGVEGDGGASGGQQGKGFDIVTRAATFLEAVRNIPLQLGRKAKFDHMRIIIIGEKVAQTQNIGDILEFFLRDHEPRVTILTAIARGKASSVLAVKPFIETTIGQQLRGINEVSYDYSAKTPLVHLLDLAIQMKSETAVAMLPIVSVNKPGKQLIAGGIALLKNGSMTGRIVSPEDTKMLLMLINQYKSSALEFPCSESAGSAKTREKKESFEVISLDTKMEPQIVRKGISVQVSTNIRGSISELRCSSLKTAEEAKKFEKRLGNYIEQEMNKTIEHFQERKVDAFGIGNKIYRKHPKLWKQWKPDWDKRFAEARFHVQVKVNVINTVMRSGTPFSKKEK